MKFKIKQAGLIAAAILCWCACTVAQLEKYFPARSVLLSLALGAITIAAGMLLLNRRYRAAGDLGSGALVAAVLLLAGCFLAIYPMSQRHLNGKGSDREDALRVELVAVTHHRYPYAARTFLDHPPSPLPGAMLLASPFYFAGRIAVQNLVWAAFFVVFLGRFYAKRSTALAFFLIFVLAAPENLNDFLVGGDYLTNIMYVAVAIYLFVHALRREKHFFLTIAAALFMGVALSSRIIYGVALIPLLAMALEVTTRKRALAMLFLVLLSFSLVTFPIFFPHPIAGLLSQLGQNSQKMAYLPKSLHAQVTLPLAAFAVACASFRGRMSLPRIYLIAGLSTLVMLLPPMASIVHASGGVLQPKITPDLLYLAASAVLISLWLLHAFESAGLRACERMRSSAGREEALAAKP